jgi:O-antigen/teichoic acid export membrane protein
MNNIGIYAIFEIISKIAIFLLIGYMAKSISIEEFAEFSLIFPALQNLQIVFTYGFVVSISAIYFTSSNKGGVIFSAILTWLILSISCLLMTYFIVTTYSDYFHESIQEIVVIIFGMSISLVLVQVYQLELMAFKAALLLNGSKFLLFIMVLFLGFSGGINLSRFLSGFAIIAIILGVFSFYKLISKSSKIFTPNIAKAHLLIGYPVVINGIVAFLMVVSGRSVLAHIGVAADVASFTIIQTIAQIITLFFAVVAKTIGIENYKRVSNKGATSEYIRDVLRITSHFLVPSILIIASQSQFILEFLSKSEYIDSINLIYLLLIGYYFQIYYAVLVDIVYAHKNTLLITGLMVCAIVVNILLTYYLYPIYGILGAVISQIITISLQSLFLIFFVKTYKISTSLYPLKLPFSLLCTGLIIINLNVINNIIITFSLVLVLLYFFKLHRCSVIKITS